MIEASLVKAQLDARELIMLRALRFVRAFRLDRILRFEGSNHRFIDYFPQMEKVDAIRRIFGDATEDVLRNLKVEFTWVGGYMWVNGQNGHLMVSSHYLNNGDKIDIYLDLIHELVHVRQFMEGKELFDEHYSYIERPTEIEAYQYAVEEARRIGLSEERICQYLKTEWMSEQDLRRLATMLNVRCE
ncbi:MAG TPA: hypothetical protein VMT01_03280 [Candidatus Acidoferrum sp.]|nr:hypothetical protein [Candidatus Acidoferrum sp.]